MRSRFIRGCGRPTRLTFVIAFVALTALAFPVTASASTGKSSHQLSVLGIVALLLFTLGVVALVLIVEKRDWTRERHRWLGLVVLVGLISSLVLIHKHHSFVLAPMLGALVLVGGGYALYRLGWRQPVFEFWPWRSGYPDENEHERDDRRRREVAAYARRQLKERLLWAGLAFIGLVGGTALIAASNISVIW